MFQSIRSLGVAAQYKKQLGKKSQAECKHPAASGEKLLKFVVKVNGWLEHQSVG